MILRARCRRSGVTSKATLRAWDLVSFNWRGSDLAEFRNASPGERQRARGLRCAPKISSIDRVSNRGFLPIGHEYRWRAAAKGAA
jgi:hypothetical protein